MGLLNVGNGEVNLWTPCDTCGKPLGTRHVFGDVEEWVGDDIYANAEWCGHAACAAPGQLTQPGARLMRSTQTRPVPGTESPPASPEEAQAQDRARALQTLDEFFGG